MRSKAALALISIAAVALGACTLSAAPASAPTATQFAAAPLTASTVPEATANPTTSPTTQPTASSDGVVGPNPPPNAIDPCTLLTADEASSVIGKKLSAGVSTTLDRNRVCTFKSGMTQVKVILAPRAPDAATAQAYFDAARSQVPAGIPVQDVPGFDRAAYGFGSAAGRSISALFVLDGTNAFEFFCAFPGCSQSKSLGAAAHISGRLH